MNCYTRNELHKKILGRTDQICQWFKAKSLSTRFTIYSSYDVRDAGYKVANVDANIFPAGFNNICPTDKESAVDIMSDYLKHNYDSSAQKIVLITEKRFHGICLGAQMLARHLGHRVYAHPQGKVEVGYYPIEPTADGHGVCDCPFPSQVYQWHREGFDLPCGAVLLATGEDFEAQAFRYGAAAYGLQFHPEVTYDMMCRWTVKGADKRGAPGAQPPHLHLEGWHRHDAPVARWTDAFLDRWTAPGQAAAA